MEMIPVISHVKVSSKLELAYLFLYIICISVVCCHGDRKVNNYPVDDIFPFTKLQVLGTRLTIGMGEYSTRNCYVVKYTYIYIYIV